GLLRTIGHLTKDKNVKRIADDAGKLLAVFEQAQKAMEAAEAMQKATGAIAGIANFMTITGAVSSAISLFTSSGPSAEQLIFEQLLAIRKDIANLHQDMMEQFEIVNTRLKNLSQDLNNSMLAQN